ncbi:hypothetical protein CDV36_004742 [Fusarium kuroshium]|uniref:Amino acid permease/ SLC12A domain-containing protein n=1 Tax=Fusarium kuroshium TaxID=2010991 RepID=A0A3M2SEJ5_9HYPO|nr:hypothetical protein CDV36_004742 [Fusarium kuroshium]
MSDNIARRPLSSRDVEKLGLDYDGAKHDDDTSFQYVQEAQISVFIIFLPILTLRGGLGHDRKGFRYWNNPGAFKLYLKGGSSGQFLGFWSYMINATFAYLGTMLVGMTIAEAQNPRKTIPRAIKLIFYRILFFYCISVLLVAIIILYNSKKLAFATKGKTGASASPFVVVAKVARVKVVPHIINACILAFVFSASNSDLYIASGTLCGLASNGQAPAIFKCTDKRGVPYYALSFSILYHHIPMLTQ